MAYTAIPEDKLHHYDDLPEQSGDAIIYPLSRSNIPPTAKEVLLYLWATTTGDKKFDRYYYRIQTTDGKNYYNQYMNVATSTDVSLNSANLWMPVFKDHGNVTVLLNGPEKSSKKGKSIAYRGDGIRFSGFFVLGYRC